MKSLVGGDTGVQRLYSRQLHMLYSLDSLHMHIPIKWLVIVHARNDGVLFFFVALVDVVSWK